MKITQVQLENGKTLNLGDRIVVEYKPLIGDEEAKEPIQEPITVAQFKPYQDESGDVWIVSEAGEVFAESNYVKHV